jgi:hypothetical protein
MTGTASRPAAEAHCSLIFIDFAVDCRTAIVVYYAMQVNGNSIFADPGGCALGARDAVSDGTQSIAEQAAP